MIDKTILLGTFMPALAIGSGIGIGVYFDRSLRRKILGAIGWVGIMWAVLYVGVQC